MAKLYAKWPASKLAPHGRAESPLEDDQAVYFLELSPPILVKADHEKLIRLFTPLATHYRDWV